MIFHNSNSAPRFYLAITLPFCVLASPAIAQDDAIQSTAHALINAYPDHLSQFKHGDLIWRDGTSMAFDDGQPNKPFKTWLAKPDIKDMFRFAYTKGALTTPPPINVDPGRARNTAFFDKMYGDCRKGQVKKHLANVTWLPRKASQTFRVTKINGVATALQKVSNQLDRFPARFDKFLKPSAGAYNCRVIAGTNRVSGHGYGIAIDIAVKQSDYWRWSKPKPDGSYAYKNKIPFEIVEVFEAHGFIWGGKWHHYDTMHFEYRPELLVNN